MGKRGLAPSVTTPSVSSSRIQAPVSSAKRRIAARRASAIGTDIGIWLAGVTRIPFGFRTPSGAVNTMPSRSTGTGIRRSPAKSSTFASSGSIGASVRMASPGVKSVPAISERLCTLPVVMTMFSSPHTIPRVSRSFAAITFRKGA